MMELFVRLKSIAEDIDKPIDGLPSRRRLSK